MTVMQRFRPKQAAPTTTGPFLPSVWPTDIFVHDSWVLVTFKGVPPRRYDSLSDVLESIGIAGRPSRMHPLLMLIARAASEPAVARCSTLETQAHGELRVLAVPRPDHQLKARLPTAELEIVQCLVEGLSHQDMALRRGTSTRTIANQISTVFRRLRVSGRNELLQRLLFNHEHGGPAETEQAVPKAPSSVKRRVSLKPKPGRLKQHTSCTI